MKTFTMIPNSDTTRNEASVKKSVARAWRLYLVVCSSTSGHHGSASSSVSLSPSSVPSVACGEHLQTSLDKKWASKMFTHDSTEHSHILVSVHIRVDAQYHTFVSCHTLNCAEQHISHDESNIWDTSCVALQWHYPGCIWIPFLSVDYFPSWQRASPQSPYLAKHFSFVPSATYY